jgi:hypothetical protein
LSAFGSPFSISPSQEVRFCAVVPSGQSSNASVGRSVPREVIAFAVCALLYASSQRPEKSSISCMNQDVMVAYRQGETTSEKQRNRSKW